MSKFCRIYTLTFLFNIPLFLFGQLNDTLIASNQIFDSIIHTEKNDVASIFYKHRNDVLINNLGTYGTSFYYPTPDGVFTDKFTSLKKHNSLINLQGVKPLTRITYINAGRREQLFSLTHQNQFGKGLNFFLDIDKISSPGTFINQEVGISDFFTELSYKNKSGSYFGQLSISYFRKKQQENGGLFNQKQYEQNLFEDPLSVNVNLTNSNSQFTNYTYQIYQHLRISKLNKNEVYTALSNKYEINERFFNDNDVLSSIYNTVRLDSLFWIDSISFSKFENTAYLGMKNKRFNISVFGEHAYNTYYQTSGIDTNFNDVFAGGKLIFNGKRICFSTDGKYGLVGYRQNDWRINSSLKVDFSKKVSLNIDAFSHFLEPDLKYVRYSSNHFYWKNYSLDKQLTSGVYAGLFLDKYRLSFLAKSRIVSNYIYFDEQININQHQQTSLLNSFSVTKEISWKKFHFRTALIYQTTSDAYLFPLPDFIGRQLVYFQSYAFKKAVKIQLGFNVSFTTKYYGYAYMPEIGEFYIQKRQQLGEYPFLDVFLNMRVKRAQVFLKYEHLNTFWTEDKFYATANYPAMSKSLKIGIVWNLVD